MQSHLRSLAAVVTLACLLVWPSLAAADHLQSSVEKVVRWAGCSAEVVTSDEYNVTTSHYNFASNTLYIGTDPDFPVPAAVSLMIWLHEIGHCMQNVQGYLIPMASAGERIAIELDADRWAADLACDLGLDGRRMLDNVWIWAHEVFGYEGDYNHGSIYDRMAQSIKATHCDGHSPQAQFADVRYPSR